MSKYYKDYDLDYKLNFIIRDNKKPERFITYNGKTYDTTWPSINKPVKVEWKHPVTKKKIIITKYPIWETERDEDLSPEQLKRRQRARDYFKRNNL